ncbi:MAG TPA: bacillithiol biosynthesis deacetylase BshB1 [Candidatus Acidoferrales bacterium]|nr:bacillithiol biosynthesis deacetylase BshB1 [Candidatus Acidoferrales bacterium]
MNLDLLAIAAHPDDVELTCGGTLLKAAQDGYSTGILDLTRGEMGTRGDVETRRREAAAAARILRVRHRESLGLPDARLAADEKSKLAVARAIRLLRPHSVILPYWEARHPDHYTASKLGYEGCFMAGLKRLALDGEPFRPFKILYTTAYAHVRPTFVVDITKQFPGRARAITCYRSQFQARSGNQHTDKKSKVHIPLDRLSDHMELLARHYGEMIGVRYGEPFLVKELMEVDDVVRLPVRSI